MDAAPGYEIFDDVCAAVFELARIDFVLRIVLGQLGGAKIGVHGGEPGVGGDVVHPDPGGTDFRRFGLADVEQQTGRAHGRERARGHHVDFTGGFFRAHAPDGLGHFLSVEDNGPAFFDTLVDFRNCLDNLMRRHNIFPRQLVGSLGGRRSVLLPLTVIISPSGSP